jgi:hypothetical protein
MLHEAYTEWSLSIIGSYARLYSPKKANDLFKENGYSITIMMDREKVSSASHRSEAGLKEWIGFDRFYKWTCRSMLGSGFNHVNKRDQQPLVLVFLDVEGTADGRFQDQVEGIHFHSVWIVPDHLRERFEEWIMSPETRHKARHKFAIMNMDVRRVDGTPRRLLSYAGKFMKSDRLISPVSKLFDVYPKGLAGIDDGPMKGV